MKPVTLQYERNISGKHRPAHKRLERGYLNDTGEFGLITLIAMRVAAITLTSFIVHAEHRKRNV
jgi:hypothetical protein